MLIAALTDPKGEKWYYNGARESEVVKWNREQDKALSSSSEFYDEEVKHTIK